MEAPEAHPPHRPHRGALPVWLEWVTSISALVVSICSIAIAVHHGDAMDKLVQANSYPYLDVNLGNAANDTLESKRRLALDLINSGVGPAHEQSMTLRVGDHYATSFDDLVATVAGPKDAAAARAALKSFRSVAPTRFIPANTRKYVFEIYETSENSRWWRMMESSLYKSTIDVCYCSVFKECWTRRDGGEPVSVKACHRDPAREYNN